MGWIFSLLPFLVFFFIVVSVVRTAAKVARKLSEQSPRPASPANFDPAEAARTRRIQEEIRKKIAERRGRANPAQLPPATEPVPGFRDVVAAPPQLPPSVPSTNVILERQNHLAEQMRELEAARLLEQRKAAKLAATVELEKAAVASSAVRPDTLLGDLRDPSSIRRAIVLREILGTPVGLR